jgi:hypothetical protein
MSGRRPRLSRSYYLPGDVVGGRIVCGICKEFCKPEHLDIHGFDENARVYREALAALFALEKVALVRPSRRNNLIANQLALRADDPT